MRCASLLPSLHASLLASLLAFIAAFSLAPLAHGQCPSAGDCREIHASAGCEMPECCTLVCDADPLCCALAWDQTCVDIALELCDGISCPSDGACSEIHENSGCEDYICCELITTLDWWCTYAAWDEVCAREAQELCGVSGCTLATTEAIDESEPCYERLNDGCGIGFPSERITVQPSVLMTGRITGGAPRDLDWFALDGALRTRRRVTIEAEFPIEVQYLRGDCDGPNETQWLAAFPLCQGAQTLVFLTASGTSSFILGTGNAERPYRDGLDCPDIDPENPPDPKAPPPLQIYGARWYLRIDSLSVADINGDGSVSAADLALLLAQWGPIDQGEPTDATSPDADLDGDHAIGAADLSLLLAEWS